MTILERETEAWFACAGHNKTMEYIKFKYLKVEAGVRYWEDATVNGVEDEGGTLIPFRSGDLWCPMVDIQTGTIIGWPKGTVANIHYKVCDAGEYQVLDSNHVVVSEREGYVPQAIDCSEDHSSYGDYIIWDVDGDGVIARWKPFGPTNHGWKTSEKE
jgi:hypothetical protein